MISSLMPHSGKMVLADDIVEYDKEHAKIKSLIAEDNAFLDNGKFPSYILCELMAQCLVSFRGLSDKQNANTLGFLLGIRNFKIFKPCCDIGDEIITEIKISIQDDNGLGIYDGKCTLNGETIAQGTITALNPDKQYLDEIIKKSE
ncbi:MAG: thioester dehydrase [Campylobacter sp.]|nr:thioester dehydrase [Campylobacter sp.]